MSISERQQSELLRGPDAKAVHQRSQAGRTFSYLTQHSVRTELIRTFGFDGWQGEVVSADLVSQREVPKSRGDGTQWEVCWHVRYTLNVRWDSEYPTTSVWTEDAVGSATGPTLPDVLDQALKSAASDAMKRCAMNLGSRFGLGLYFDGYLGDIVRSTIDTRDAEQKPQKDKKIEELRERITDLTNRDVAAEVTGLDQESGQ